MAHNPFRVSAHPATSNIPSNLEKIKILKTNKLRPKSMKSEHHQLFLNRNKKKKRKNKFPLNLSKKIEKDASIATKR